MSPADYPALSLLTFPCRFPVKVMGEGYKDFAADIFTLVHHYDPELQREDIKVRASRGGRFLGLTVTVNATDRLQLDAIYLALTAHPWVRMVL